jgi:hypothetical protein
MRNTQLCSYPRISQHFTEPKDSLSCSQEPSTGPYPEPDQSNRFRRILKKGKILYNVRVLDRFWSPIVPCYVTEDAVRIVNFFITIPITCNYNHNYFLRCYAFTQLSSLHVRNYNHLLHSYTGWLLSYQLLSQIIIDSVFTRRNSRRELTPRIHFLRLLLNNSLVGLRLTNCLLHSHSGNWTKPAKSFAYIAELC